MDSTSNVSPAAAVPVSVKMPEPITEPIPRATRLHKPSERRKRACGSSLGGDRCPSCGFVNASGQRFCGHCGVGLTGSQPTPAPGPVTAIRPGEERKMATVLFADVVGFTTLAELADPEAVAGKVDTAFRRMATVVTNHGPKSQSL